MGLSLTQSGALLLEKQGVVCRGARELEFPIRDNPLNVITIQLIKLKSYPTRSVYDDKDLDR